MFVLRARLRPRLRFVHTPVDDGGATPPTPDGQVDAGQSGDGQGDSGEGEPLGEGGVRALRAERDRANRLERENAALRAQANQRASGEQSAEQRLATVEQTLAETQAEARRYRIATTHGLSADDANLLVGDETQMQALASRLAGVPAPPPQAPKPDGVQRLAANEVNAEPDGPSRRAQAKDIFAARHGGRK